ncbi:hypothetical protein LTS18_004152 [Coniosporium uncinatum]|uniref:Uncharacterized protein n=1 Tax=Coniosporium uncinatum TaxID=93489 RepID=A0ACC3D6J6_9PEZI|nr:hypothetical protein LTS18_004152 [Coniosporium uncinatum]
MERPTRAGHYRTLGLSKLATKDDIKKAYPKRVLEVHPDKTARATAAEFIQVKEAYDLLSDDSRRKTYDINYASIHAEWEKYEHQQRKTGRERFNSADFEKLKEDARKFKRESFWKSGQKADQPPGRDSSGPEGSSFEPDNASPRDTKRRVGPFAEAPKKPKKAKISQKEKAQHYAEREARRQQLAEELTQAHEKYDALLGAHIISTHLKTVPSLSRDATWAEWDDCISAKACNYCSLVSSRSKRCGAVNLVACEDCRASLCSFCAVYKGSPHLTRCPTNRAEKRRTYAKGFKVRR